MYAPSKKPLLRRRNSQSKTLQSFLDGLSIILLYWGLVYNTFLQIDLHYTIFLLLFMGVMGIVYDRLAIYRSNANFMQKTLSLVKGWSLSFLIVMVVGFLSKESETYSRLLLSQFFILGLLTQLLLHFLFYVGQKKWLNDHGQTDKAVVIGCGNLAGYLYHKIQNNPWLSQTFVGVILPGKTSDTNCFTDEITVLGYVDDLDNILKDQDIDIVYVVTSLHSSAILEQVYFKLLDKHLTIHWVPDIFSLRLVNHSVTEIAGIPILTLSETPLTGTSQFMKSVEDRVLGGLITLLAAPLMLLVALAVKFDSPGPVFFRQQRTGFSGKTFIIWKFRSMKVANESTDAETKTIVKQATRDDPRVTRVGRFIRKTSLDELPQLLNVLKGDMSLVGPRPHAVQHDEEYSQRISSYFARNKIKPGLTGLAQVRGLRGETEDVNKMIERVESDIEYINNWSIGLDLIILLRTLTVFFSKNAY